MTTGIVIAAGLGSRMPSLTHELPKAMLPVGGRPLLHNTIDRLRDVGCEKIVVVTGYLAEKISAPNIVVVENSDYKLNNILHSLMYARAHLLGPVFVSYSDIWIEPDVMNTLADTTADIAIAVDSDWQPYYEGRMDHPIGEAESVYYDSQGEVVEIGKHLLDTDPAPLICGEFLGLWKMSEAGSAKFVDQFDRIDARLSDLSPFQKAKEWRKAYITDLLQEMVSNGGRVSCALVERGWAELDTEEDFHRLSSIARRQRLHNLVRLLEAG